MVFCAESFAQFKDGELRNQTMGNKIPPASPVFFPDENRLGERVEEKNDDTDEDVETVEECNAGCDAQYGFESNNAVCGINPDGFTYSICMYARRQKNKLCKRECDGDVIPEIVPTRQPPRF